MTTENFNIDKYKKQCVSDGNDKLIPLVEVFHTDLKTIKNKLGKGLWKKVCAGKKEEIKILCEHMKTNLCSVSIKGKQVLSDKDYLSIFDLDEDIRSAYISSIKNNKKLSIERIITHTDKHNLISEINRNFPEIKFKDIVKRIINNNDQYTVRDTSNFCKSLSVDFNINWSPRKMKEKHDQYQYDAMLKKIEISGIDINKELDIQIAFKESILESFCYMKSKSKYNNQVSYLELVKIDTLPDGGMRIYCDKPYLEYYYEPYINYHEYYDNPINRMQIKSNSIHMHNNKNFDVFKNCIFDIDFLETPKKMVQETYDMKHCIGNYVYNVIRCQYICFNVKCRDIYTKEIIKQATVGINIMCYSGLPKYASKLINCIASKKEKVRMHDSYLSSYSSISNNNSMHVEQIYSKGNSYCGDHINYFVNNFLCKEVLDFIKPNIMHDFFSVNDYDFENDRILRY